MAGENLKEIFKQQDQRLDSLINLWSSGNSNRSQKGNLREECPETAGKSFITTQKSVEKNRSNSSLNLFLSTSSSSSNNSQDLQLSTSDSSLSSVMSEMPTATLEIISSSLKKLIDPKNASVSVEVIEKFLFDYISKLINYYKFHSSPDKGAEIRRDKTGELLKQVLSCFNCESYFLFGSIKISLNYNNILTIYNGVVSDKQFIGQKIKDLLLYALVKSENFGSSEDDVVSLTDFMKRMNVVYVESERDELILAVRANQENIIGIIEGIFSKLDFLILKNGEKKYESLIPIILGNARIFCNQYNNSNERLLKLVEESGKKRGVLVYDISEIIKDRDLFLESGKNYPEFTDEEANKKSLLLSLSVYLDNLLLNIIQGSPNKNKWLLLIESCCEITQLYKNGFELKEMFEKVWKFREQIVEWLLRNEPLVWEQDTSVEVKKEIYQQLLKILFNYEDAGHLYYRVLSYLSGSEQQLYGLNLTEEDKLPFLVLLAKYWHNEISKSSFDNQYKWFETPALFTTILETSNQKKLVQVDLFGIEDPINIQDLCANYLGQLLSCKNAKYSNFELTLDPNNIENLSLFYSSDIPRIFDPVLLDLVKIVSDITDFGLNNKLSLFFTAHITLCLLYADKNNMEKIRADLVLQANDLRQDKKEIFNRVLDECCNNWAEKYSDIKPENQDLEKFYAILGRILNEHDQKKEQNTEGLIKKIGEEVKKVLPALSNKVFYLDENTGVSAEEWLTKLENNFEYQKFLEVLSANMNYHGLSSKEPVKILSDFYHDLISLDEAKKELELHYASQAYQGQKKYFRKYGLCLPLLDQMQDKENKVRLPLDYLNVLATIDNDKNKELAQKGLFANQYAIQATIINGNACLSSSQVGGMSNSFPSPSPIKGKDRRYQNSLSSPSNVRNSEQWSKNDFTPIKTSFKSTIFGASTPAEPTVSLNEEVAKPSGKIFSLHGLNFQLKSSSITDVQQSLSLPGLLKCLRVRPESFVDLIKDKLGPFSEEDYANMLPEFKGEISEEVIKEYINKIKYQNVLSEDMQTVKRQIESMMQYQHEPNTRALLIKSNLGLMQYQTLKTIHLNPVRSVNFKLHSAPIENIARAFNMKKMENEISNEILAEFSNDISRLNKEPKACIDYFRGLISKEPCSNIDEQRIKLKYIWLTSYFGVKLLENKLSDAYLTNKEAFLYFISDLVKNNSLLGVQILSNIVRIFNHIGFIYPCIIVEKQADEYVLNNKLSCFKANEVDNKQTLFILHDPATGSISELKAKKLEIVQDKSNDYGAESLSSSSSCSYFV